ncbi:ankyrin repeat domain-containing protein [Streptomyces sp. HUAS MG47]|uniref:ankyrin repeat domain-containing protein n=1 Tax=Streptomyces solicamelliae TaxID=3231716 RepID=UPI00387840D9
MSGREHGWGGLGWEGWKDLDLVRRLLAEGADPEEWRDGLRALHRAALLGAPEVVAELAVRVADVDGAENGVTALWEAVFAGRADNARALAAVGADPWRPQLAGWSPGRLSLAGPTPGLFARPATEPGLTPAEAATATEGRRLVAALGDLWTEGLGLACVAGIDADEAVRRLEATPTELPEEPGEFAYEYDFDETLSYVGVTTVPGGCVVTQPWGYMPQTPRALVRLTAGTYGYGVYCNPKSGDQGSIVRDGRYEGSDLHPGGGPDVDSSPEDVLAAYLYRHHAPAYACAFAGLRLDGPRAVTGPPDVWAVLPDRDWWER